MVFLNFTVEVMNDKPLFCGKLESDMMFGGSWGKRQGSQKKDAKPQKDPQLRPDTETVLKQEKHPGLIKAINHAIN